MGLIFSFLSSFLKKEISSARNVKDKKNNKLILKNLEKISVYIQTCKESDFIMGMYIFSGIDVDDKDYFKVFVPKIKCPKFVYRCYNKFLIDGLDEYLKEITGSIIFVNLQNLFIYNHTETGFKLIERKSIDIGNRHNKGGQSQRRHERNFDIIKDNYVTIVSDEINSLHTDKKWVFGSVCLVNTITNECKGTFNGGFLEFDKNTIKNVDKWVSYLKIDYEQFNKNEKIFENTINCIKIDTDILDFDPTNKENMRYYITKNKEDDSKNAIHLLTNSKFYDQLHLYEYIGIKYYSCEEIF